MKSYSLLCVLLRELRRPEIRWTAKIRAYHIEELP